MTQRDRQPLRGRRILVVEDEYFIATALADWLTEWGAEVIGPVATVDTALQRIADAQQRLDGAVLDINLRNELVFRVADSLLAQNVPFVFTSGYDAAVLPVAHAHRPRCTKPVEKDALIRCLLEQLYAADHRAGQQLRTEHGTFMQRKD